MSEIQERPLGVRVNGVFIPNNITPDEDGFSWVKTKRITVGYNFSERVAKIIYQGRIRLAILVSLLVIALALLFFAIITKG